MARIVCGVCGEGRGHAARMLVILGKLAHIHQFHVFASGDAYRLLRQRYDDDQVQITEIPGLRFRYTDQRVSYVKSLAAAVPFVFRLRSLVAGVRQAMEAARPDLVITDFEPLTARAARDLDVPLMSVDHQRFITDVDLTPFGRTLALKGLAMRQAIELYYSWQQLSVVSSFFGSHLPSTADRIHTGVLLREQIRRALPRNDGHLLVYLRKHTSPQLLQLLRQSGRPTIVYGHHAAEQQGNLQFKPIAPDEFCADLSSCAALICTAGNQLVGEAIYLQKPVLAFPEPGNAEQVMNGSFLNRMGAGRALPLQELTNAELDTFLQRGDEYRQAVPRNSVVGNGTVFQAIEGFVGSPLPSHIEPVRTGGALEVA